ncbi:universal stress protein [Rubellimicrobium roseum]|uniref:Universal stress protein n=1 Tax=Rubellimicrobium roseum TaxID=687525 RepID=A0A5C4N688_9RHOB|nr:universal stress protein [Rubellimicrobium roseum]TNC59443.1 universal stress protein [Rubellimicrobium roseum]
MTDKILALVDGSIYSESVCHHAAWAAARLNAGVDLLHVLGRREVPTGDLSAALRLGARTALLEDLAQLDAQRAKLAQAKGRAILEDAKTILEKDGIRPVTARLRQGDLLEAVAVLEPEVRAIVIGKRGEAADFAAGHVGSNLERVVRSVHVPVLVACRAFRPIARVIVAFDASQSARRAIERMAGSPVFQGLSVTMVHAGESSRELLARMDEARATLEAAGLSVASEVVSGDPEVALRRKVETEGFDLLVMGAYGHSRIRNLIIGSTTTAMIQACRIPVLLYR